MSSQAVLPYILILGAHGQIAHCDVSSVYPEARRTTMAVVEVHRRLTADDLGELNEAYAKVKVQGARLSEEHMELIDSTA